MHSTVQTGLFTPNIYNCDHNLYHPSNHNRNGQYHLPPHHHHLNCQRSHAKEVSLHSSLLGINLINSSHCDLNKNDSYRGSKTNLSTSNITKVFSSSKNLDLNTDSNLKRKESSTSSSSINGAKVSRLNLNENVENNLNNSRLSINHHNTQHQNQHYTSKSFWDCSKPCGILTLALAIVLLVLSSLCFVFLIDKFFCNLTKTCANALVTLGGVSFLVIGIVLIFIGLVIIIYTKKDVNAKVIITTASNFDRMISMNKMNKFPSTNDVNLNKEKYLNGSVPLLNKSSSYANEMA